MREIRTLRSTWRGLETWCDRGRSIKPARQSPTLPEGGVAKAIPTPIRDAMEALRRAIILRQPPPGLIHHSDRGSQLGFNRSSQRTSVVAG